MSPSSQLSSARFRAFLLICLVPVVSAGCSDESPAVPSAAADIAADLSVDLPYPDVDLSVCLDDQCLIDDVCIDNLTNSEDNPCEVCLVARSRVEWTFDDEAACDDGDLCTTGDTCFEGTCMALVVTCDDSNPCTANVCDTETGECNNPPDNEATCFDGDPCSTGDFCQGGACQGGTTALNCDDENVCTLDSCVSNLGCTTTPLSDVGCDDNNACTLGDTCLEGVCQPGNEELACDDDDVCTANGCDPESGCVFNDLSSLCEDENPCTDELCDAEDGCVYPFNEVMCNDGTLCTDDDVCVSGACLGTPVSLDDGNVCTALSCDPDIGVITDFVEGACSDGNECTVGNTCDMGACDEGDPRTCDDDDVCTDNLCDPDLEDGCTFPYNTVECVDGSECTIGDVCDEGVCAGVLRTCDDGNACTNNMCNPGLAGGCHYPTISSFDCRPVITLTNPQRAETIDQDSNTVVVTGSVESSAGVIDPFTINGDVVTVMGDGSFSYDMAAIIGGNILKIEATDALDTTERIVQSFLLSNDYKAPDASDTDSEYVPEGMGIWFDETTLDDDESTGDPNDFAHIFELALSAMDLGVLLPSSISESVFDFDVNGASFASVAVDIDPQTDNLEVVATFYDFSVFLTHTNIDPTRDATFHFDTVTMTIDVGMEVVAHQLDVTVTASDVSVGFTSANFLYDDGNGGLNEFLINMGLALGLIDPLAGTEDDIAAAVGPLMATAFGALAFDTQIPLAPLAGDGADTIVSFLTDFAAVTIQDDGLEFRMRGKAYSDEVTPPETNLGSVGRVNCDFGAQTLVIPQSAAMEIVLSDDLINQLVWGAWWGGWLDSDVPSDLLGDLSGQGITEVTMIAHGMLQPTLSDCSVDGQLRILVGDLFIDTSMMVLGAPVNADIYVSFEGNVELSATPEAIGLAVTSIYVLEAQVDVLEEPLQSLEPVILANIETSMGPALQELLGGELGSFPIPAIDLSDLVGEPLIIEIGPTDVLRDSGNTVVEGVLQ